MRPWQEALLNSPPPITDWGNEIDPAEVIGGPVMRGPSISLPGPRPSFPDGPFHPVGPRPSFPTGEIPLPGPRPGLEGPERPAGPFFPPDFERLVGRKVLEKLLGLNMESRYSTARDTNRGARRALRRL